MLFSVVIPTYNRADLLRQTLESVFRQEFGDFEVIVADDGSTDEISRVIEDFGDRIIFLPHENTGPGPTRNRGAAAAKGSYLAFLDSDDLWFPWTLAVFAGLIHEYRSPAILAARLVEFADEVELSNVHHDSVEVETFTDYLASSPRGYFVGAGMAVLRRDEFLKTGGFTDRRINAEDHDLILKMGTAPGFVQIQRPTTLGWRRHAGSSTMNLRKTYDGLRYLVEQERRGAYPGGAARSHERRRIISTHVRPAALQCLRCGMRREAWQLYRETARWNLAQGRWRFLAGFPLSAIFVPAATGNEPEAKNENQIEDRAEKSGAERWRDV